MTTATAGVLSRPRQAGGPGLLIGLIALTGAVGVIVAVKPSLAVGVIMLGVFCSLGLLAPALVTPAAIGLLVANVPGVLTASGAPATIGAAAVLLLAVPVLAHLRQGEPLVANAVLVIMLGLLAMEIVSTLTSRYEDAGLERMQSYVFEGVVLYFLAVNAIRTPEALRRVLWVVVVSVGLLAAVTIVQAAGGNFWQSYGGFALPDPSFAIGQTQEFRASGPLGDPNYYGQILVVGLALAMVFARRETGGVQRVVALGAAAFMGYAILLTYSRGTMLAAIVVLLAMAFMRYFRAWQVLTLIFVVVAVFAAVPSYAERFLSVSSVASATQETGSDPEADQSTQSRATEMRAAANVFLDHPILGVGPGAFPLYYQDYAQAIEGGQVHERERGAERRGEQPEREAHNMYLSQLAELGLVGAMLFFFAIGVTWVTLVRARRRLFNAGRTSEGHMATALLLALAGYLICSLLLTLAFERYFWLLLAFAAAASLLARPSPEPLPPARA